jgi:hypothetical protein
MFMWNWKLCNGKEAMSATNGLFDIPGVDAKNI